MGKWDDRDGAKYRDEEWLREKYVEEGLSSYEMKRMTTAKDNKTILRWLHKYDIPVEDEGGGSRVGWENGVRYAQVGGYPTLEEIIDGERERVRVHRLSAVAEYGFDAVVDADEIHHIDRVVENTARDNLAPLTTKEHFEEHAYEYIFGRAVNSLSPSERESLASDLLDTV